MLSAFFFVGAAIALVRAVFFYVRKPPKSHWRYDAKLLAVAAAQLAVVGLYLLFQNSGSPLILWMVGISSLLLIVLFVIFFMQPRSEP